jgi:ERCC4-type nuclease
MINKFNKQYSKKEIEQILSNIIILIDTREKQISHITMWLKHNKIQYIKETLSFGDYSFMIPQNIDLDITEDIYFNDIIAIERKANAEEISGNLTGGRERFKREFNRGNKKIRLLIEDSNYSDICDGKYKTDINANSFIGSLHSIQEEFNAPFFFTDKEHSGQYIYNTFKYFLRNYIKIN